jgi:hypothetical protein
MQEAPIDGVVQIWRDMAPHAGCVPVATALDLATVLAAWPFGPGQFWLWRGERCEVYEVERTRES